MVDENRTVASRIDGEIRQAHEEMAALREELADTSRRLEEHLTVNMAGGGAAAAKSSTSESSNELSSSTGHTLTSVTSNSSGDRSSESSSSKNKYDHHLDAKHSIIGKIEETDFPLTTSQNQSNGENNGDLVSSKKLVGIDLNRCKDILDSSIGVDSLVDLVDDDAGVINCDNSDRKSDASNGEMKQLIRPPSPIPGPSSKSDFGKFAFLFILLVNYQCR